MSYEADRFAASSNLLSHHPFLVHMLSVAPYSQTPLVSIPPSMSETKFYTHTEPQTKLKRLLF
jgi:hypothetical protein